MILQRNAVESSFSEHWKCCWVKLQRLSKILSDQTPGECQNQRWCQIFLRPQLMHIVDPLMAVPNQITQKNAKKNWFGEKISKLLLIMAILTMEQSPALQLQAIHKRPFRYKSAKENSTASRQFQVNCRSKMCQECPQSQVDCQMCLPRMRKTRSKWKRQESRSRNQNISIQRWIQ